MPITLSRQQLSDIYRQSRGFGENALSMITGGIGEPVAGFASLAAMARGENATGARDAVRDAFTYQPRTAEGQGQQRMLGELAQSAMNSAPVRTWQRGVDYAGRASPVAGATLQTVPTALGALAGYKPAMQTGQAVSRALAQAQRVAMDNAMRPRVLHPQRGVINVHGSDFNYGDTLKSGSEMFTYAGDVPDKPWLVRVSDASGGERIIGKRAITSAERQKPRATRSYAEDVNVSWPSDADERLFHGSYSRLPDDFKIGQGSGDRFGGIFTSRGGIEPAYSEFNYYVDIPKSKILTKQEIGYHVDADQLTDALEKASGIKRSDPSFKQVWDAVIDEQDQRLWFDDGGRPIKGKFADVYGGGGLGHAGWESQRIRGKLAKELGYDAVEMTDETGTSILVVGDKKLTRINDR